MKHYRTLIIFSLLLPVMVIITINVLYLSSLKKDAMQGKWIEEPIAKTMLANSVDELDYLFIGSSRTQNHINTELLNNMGIKALNLGTAGRYWEYYPYIIEQLSDIDANTLVINLPASALFGRVSCPKGLFYRLVFDWHSGIDRRCFSLRRLSWRQIFEALPMNRFLTALEAMSSSIQKKTKQLEILRKHYHYDYLADGRNINFVRGGKERLVVTYSNGDGQVFSHRVKNSPSLKRDLINWQNKEFNAEAISYLLKLAQLGADQGKEIIVVIEPAVERQVELIDIEKLQSILPDSIGIINNADKYYTKNLWADPAHFTIEGSTQYTQQLYTQLKNIEER